MRSAVRSLALIALISVALPISAHVTEVTSAKTFDALLATNPTELIVVDFYASWCGPCKSFAPKFEKISNSHSTVRFVKINVDTVPTITTRYNVGSMPTFVLIKNGKEVFRISGANEKALKAAIEKYK